MRADNVLALSAVAVSGTTEYDSSAIPAESFFQFTVQAVTSGSNPNGTLKVQFSNDQVTASSGTPTNWSDVTSASVATTNNGVYAINKIDSCAQWFRVVYTNASGSGTISARIKFNGV